MDNNLPPSVPSFFFSAPFTFSGEERKRERTIKCCTKVGRLSKIWVKGSLFLILSTLIMLLILNTFKNTISTKSVQ